MSGGARRTPKSEALSLNPEQKVSLSPVSVRPEGSGAGAGSWGGSGSVGVSAGSSAPSLDESVGRSKGVSGPRVVIALGVIAWAVVLAVPFAVSRPSLLAWAVLAGTLAPLMLAVIAWSLELRARASSAEAPLDRSSLSRAPVSIESGRRAPTHELARRLITLVLYPAGLAFGVALAPHVVELDAHPPTMRLLGALAFLAYGAAASVADPGTPPPGLTIKPLPAVGGDPKLVRRGRARAWLLGLGTIGGLAIAVVAPALGADPTVTFGTEAGAAADVLVAVVAAALGTSVVAGFVGPATRRRRTPTAARRAQRVGLYLLVVAVGAFVWRMLATRG